jgi:glycogen operon protein
MDIVVTSGAPEPRGVTPDATGVNVAVFSANATALAFCLFDAAGEREVARVLLPERSGDIWHGHVAGVRVGDRYGLRAHGPFAPRDGHRFNPAKLLLDPYARAIDRVFHIHPSLFGYRPGDPDADLSRDDTDSAPHMPKAIVTEAAAPCAPASLTGWADSIIYELHVRGFTMRHPDVPPALRGTFAGLAQPAAIAHLKRLGVTAVEILPAAAWIEERHLAALGLRNAWGYNSIGWLAPDPALAPGGWDEVRKSVAALEAAGIETLVDMVFNHSGEGDERGPTLSLRGLDNASYYRLARDRRYYENSTGCGHELALERPESVRLAMDSLRAWASLGGVHGFRYDLATTLGRRADGFDPAAPLLTAIGQDPVLRGLTQIAEPWDVGLGGYQVGHFPHAWGEWNDRFRDTSRRFWRGEGGLLGDFATRFAGSADLFGAKRRPARGVNFVVAHDGFTLADLVSYAQKHNEANGEGNRDGTDANHSWNNGVEGPTDDPTISAARLRDQRALLATLLLARGTPMLAMGAERGHSQAGNNNAYAQDNATIWLDWALDDHGLTDFVSRLTALRRAHPALRADRFLSGSSDDSTLLPDVEWRRPDGAAMTGADWHDGAALVAVLYAEGDRVALVLNRGGAADVTLPEPRDGMGWRIEAESAENAAPRLLDADSFTCKPRAVVVLAEVAAPGHAPRAADPVLLERLALAAGIAPEWWDIDGGRHLVSPDTKRALLAAMRLPAGTSGEARDSLSGFADSHQRRALPHAMVLREGEAASLPCALTPGSDAPTWLVLEDADGGQRHVKLTAEADGELTCADGRRVRVSHRGVPALPVGRWRLWREDAPDAVCALTVAPRACFLPPALAQEKRFGIAAHLYSVRRAADQGIGDFSTLGVLGQEAGRVGAAALGLNPLHMLWPDDRERASPYHPSDRRFLDPIYLDVANLDSDAARALLGASESASRALGAAGFVDYPRAWAIKRDVLAAAFAESAEAEGDTAFAAFLAEGGAPLERFATFQAITETHPRDYWRRWPEALRDAHGPGVAAFAAAHASRVRYHQWLQFLCDRQLGEAAAKARAGGLSLGLYRDLAVGTAPDGAEAWAGARELADGASIGAPPDPFSESGQIWGLPPPDPWRLREGGLTGFAGLLGANMRHAGGLRIDHVLGLARLFWVPNGAAGADGAYVANPLRDLLGTLALESARANCFVVGEDLGTVPEGLREALAEADVLSYRVLWFERAGAAFLPAASYPRQAVACISTHDLATLAGWRAGADIAERAALGHFAPDKAAVERQARAAEQIALAATIGAPPDPPAVHGFIAGTPCCLVMAQADDLAGETMAVNLPGTDRERPNWRRKIAIPVPELLDAPAARAILARVAEGRVALPTFGNTGLAARNLDATPSPGAAGAVHRDTGGSS